MHLKLKLYAFTNVCLLIGTAAQDTEYDNWWLEYDWVPVGYWPGLLVKNMMTSAGLVQWGGQVCNTAPGGHHTSTQMGSSHLPKKAAFLKENKYLNQ